MTPLSGPISPAATVSTRAPIPTSPPEWARARRPSPATTGSTAAGTSRQARPASGSGGLLADSRQVLRTRAPPSASWYRLWTRGVSSAGSLALPARTWLRSAGGGTGSLLAG